MLSDFSFLKRYKSRTRKSVLLSLILSNLFILLVPMAMGFFLYAKVESAMKGNAEKYNLAMLEQLRLSMDSHLNGMDILSQQVVLNPKLNYLLNVSDVDGTEKSGFIDFIRNYLDQYRKSTGSFIEGFYIYFKNSDTIVSSGAMADPATYYEAHQKQQVADYETWYGNILNGYHNREFIHLEGDVIAYVQSLPISDVTDVKGTFVILLNGSQVKEMFSQIESVNESSIYILDRNNRLVLGTGGDLPEEVSRLPAKQSGLIESDINGTHSMISYTSSNPYGLKYISVTPMDTFMQRVNQIKTWALAVLALCLIGGVSAVLTASYRSYSPIKRMVNSIVQSNKTGRTPFENEFDFITKTIESSLLKEQDLLDKLSQQMPVIRANFLARLLRGHVEADETGDRQQSLQLSDIEFVSNHFAVLLVHIEDIARFTIEQTERQWVLSRFIIANIGEDITNVHHKGYSVELDRDRLAILVNFRKERVGLEMNDLERMAESLKHVIIERFKIFVTIAVSNIHEGIDRIGDCWIEAQTAADYTIVKGKSQIIYYRDIREVVGKHYYYPLETEVRLVNFVKSGDTQSVAKLLDDIYTMNFISNSITPELGKLLFFNIISTYLKIINTVSPNHTDFLGENFDPIQQLFTYQTADEIHGKAKHLYDRLTVTFQKGLTDRGTQMFQDIVGLIESHLSNSSLGLPFIAEHLNVTPQYVSSFFKKYSGQNITDYITRQRIDKAKRLLEETHLANAQIAEMVGYTSTVVFIRSFKKLEGVTPGKYRD